MSHILEKQPKKFVVGISIKTSNEHFANEGVPLWSRFYSEGIGDKIVNRLNQNILAVYTEYEGDYTKPFTYLIGCEVTSLESIPEGMIGIEIPDAEYAVFTAAGEFPLSMLTAWQTIWQSNVNRSYTTDFEVYGSDFNPQGTPEIKIYIATEAE